MRLLGIFSLLSCLSIPLEAADFQYELNDKDIPLRASLLLQFHTVIRAEGYDPISFSLKGNHPVLFVDQVFENFSRTKRIFLKFGLKPNSRKVLKTTQKIASGFVYHDTFQDIPYAMYFEGFEEESTLKLSMKIQSELVNNHKTSQFKFSIFESANAASSTCSPSSSVSPTSTLISDISVAVGGVNLLTALQDCLVSALNGLVDGARGLASGTVNAIRTLATNPGELWQSVNTQFQRFREVLGSLHNSIAGAISSFDGLSPEVTKAILCGLVGAMAPQLLRALSPAGAAALGALVATATQKIVSILRNFRRMIPNIPTPDARRAWAARAGACAVR